MVMAMALLHGARVLAAADWEGARQIYAEGCAAVDGLALDGNLRDLVSCEVVKLGASVDPLAALARFRRLPRGPYEFLHQSIGTELVQQFAQQVDFDAAVEFLEDLSCPAGGAGVVMHRCPDIVLQRRAMAAGLQRWRMSRRPGPPFAEHDFLHVFSHFWEKLEPAEQVSWLDEILRSIESEPDSPTTAGSAKWSYIRHTTGACSRFSTSYARSNRRNKSRVSYALTPTSRKVRRFIPWAEKA